MADKPTIYEALNAVSNDVTFIGKNNKNTHQGFNFRGIDDVMNTFGPSLRRHGVIAIPRVVSAKHGEKQTRNSVAKTVDLIVEYIFYGPAGDSITSSVAAESFDSGDKATAKAMSAAMRTAFLQVFCLPTNEPDPDEFSYEIIDADGRAKFLEKLAATTDIDVVRGMQKQAERWDAKKEWLARGTELKNAGA